MEEILQRVKDENATGIHVEAISKEILQRIKDEGLTVDATAKDILQRLKNEEPIRESNVMKWECLGLMQNG